MIHLVCSCGYESWSWSAQDPDPIARDFTTAHQRRGHTVTHRPIRSRRVTDGRAIRNAHPSPRTVRTADS